MRPLFPPRPILGPIEIPSAYVVSVPAPIFIRHYGLVSDVVRHGAPDVISLPNAKGGVVEESWEEFAGGNPVRVDGYLGSYPPSVVLDRARSCIGQLPWRFSFNCEHFVSWCHGLEPRSPQLENWIAVAGLGALMAKFWK
ncbi:MAG: lecithin retinol acyltransferase family protein [Vicinamibacteria bacterium]